MTRKYRTAQEVVDARKMMPKQVDLFLNPIPLCPFCGYPMLPMNAVRCEYGYASSLDNFEPFKVYWHVDLDKEDRFNEQFAEQISAVVQKALEDRPRLVEKIRESRLESWVEEHGPKKYVPPSQVSLISYLIGDGC